MGGGCNLLHVFDGVAKRALDELVSVGHAAAYSHREGFGPDENVGDL